MNNIFSGVRVLDVASFVAAPGAATLLADFGADVIKIEPPGGEGWRNVTPPSRANAPWLLTSRNKRGLVLDLTVDTGLNVLKRMIAEADVLVLNFRRKQLERYGLRYEDLVNSNPRLVYAYVNGYGERGTDADRKAFDPTAFFARTGILDMLRNKDEGHPFPTMGVGDHATAMTLFAGIAASLFKRERTGQGSKVSTSLMANGTWANGFHVQNALCGFDISEFRDQEGWTNPFANLYTTADARQIYLLMANPAREWTALLQALNCEHWSEDPRFSNQKQRNENRTAVRRMISEAISKKTLADLATCLNKYEIAFSEICKLKQVISDPQMMANEVVVPVDWGDDRVSRTITNPIRINDSTHSLNAAPNLGEHSAEVLTQYGFTATEINQLRTEQVLGLQPANIAED